MSWVARQVVAHLEQDLRRAEEEQREKERRVYWTRYATRLTPRERERIQAEDYSPLRRPYKPTFKTDDWLQVSAHLRIQIGDVTEMRNAWRVRLGTVEDFRTTGSRFTTKGEDRESMKNTLALVSDKAGNAPEPHGPDPATLKLYAAEAGAKKALGDNDHAEQVLAEIKQLPARRRMVELHKLASERGVDVRDDVKAFERRVLRRLGKAA